MKIYLVRHGETTGDIEDRYGGDYDDHLTTRGQEQSKNVAEKFAGRDIEKIFSSPKTRAQETASIVSTRLGLDVVTLDDFRERNRYGVLTGLVKSDAKNKYLDQVELLDDEHSTLENGEPYEDFKNRIKTALLNLENEDCKTVIVVTHGGPLRYIFRELLKYGEVNVGDCSFVLLNGNDGVYEIKELDGISQNSGK